MRPTIAQKLQDRKSQVQSRIEHRPGCYRDEPMFAASNIHFELSDRSQAVSCGGVGLMFAVAQKLDLVQSINDGLNLLRVHQPYSESDHVLNIAFNVLAGGTRLEHIERRRSDEAYLNAIGAIRIPDPTTSGDFCRRFKESDILKLMDIFNKKRVRVWKTQPRSFFDEAFIDADGTLVETDACKKEGVDIAYNGVWGYHPLVISLANTQEPLFIVNRSGNRPSHERAHEFIDESIELCLGAGFRKVCVRGDTDFTQTKHLDRWADLPNVSFVFGMDARANLIDIAENLPADAYSLLRRPSRHKARTKPRSKRHDVKKRIVREREFENITLEEEQVAEFSYKPTACRRSYRVVALRKKLGIEKGQMRLLDEYRYYFYITNRYDLSTREVVFLANDRCDQENLLAQLKGEMRALSSPVDNLESNWAYMVMASLAWSLKAWAALLMTEDGRDEQEKDRRRSEKRKLLRMEFTTFRAAIIDIPCQIVRSGRRLIYRVLTWWSPWLDSFFEIADRVQFSRLC